MPFWRNNARRALTCCHALLALQLAVSAAHAQDAGSNNPLSSVLRATGVQPAAGDPMPDFVKNSRPPAGEMHYVPLGKARAEPPDKPLSRDDILAQEAELGALRAHNNVRVGRKPPVVVAASAAGQPFVRKKKKAKKPCRLTCKIDTKIGSNDFMQ